MAAKITWEKRGPYIEYSGLVTFADFLSAVMEIHANQNYSSIKYVIHDMSTVEELDFTEVDMTRLIVHELGARFTNPTVKGVVISNDPTMAALTTQFKSVTDLDIRLFKELAQARDWIAKELRV